MYKKTGKNALHEKLVPNFYIHVAVSDLYILTIDPLFCYFAFADRCGYVQYINGSPIHEC
jgi:hypothetical protein